MIEVDADNHEDDGMEQLPLFETPKSEERPRKPAPEPTIVSDEWPTPDRIMALAIEVLGAIDLDPCSDSKGAPTTPARHRYRSETGLKYRWHGRVWLNAPSGRVIEKWVNKLVGEYENGDVTGAIALLPARPETQWWQLVARYPVCLIRGRLHFPDAERAASYPSAVLYLGPLLTRFASTFGAVGTIYTPFGVSDLPPSPIWDRER
jgi:hypothetical protein